LAVWGGNAYITAQDVQLWEDVRDISNWSERMRSTLGAVYGDELQPMNDRFTDGMGAIMSDKDGDVCLGALHQIACPTLVLAGEHDAMVCDHGR
jgi:pimeloyl-ACP methyl ester carboxylesterase